MKYPELFLVPILMFVDYFLTLAGAVLKDKKYGEHFKLEHYELNPVWQRDIAQRKWFNPRQILLVVLVSAVIIALMEFGQVPETFIQGLMGCLLVSLGMITGRHLANLMTFRYMAYIF